MKEGKRIEREILFNDDLFIYDDEEDKIIDIISGKIYKIIENIIENKFSIIINRKEYDIYLDEEISYSIY